MSIKLLLVEDSLTQAMAIQEMLEEVEGVDYDVEWIKTYDDALKELSRDHYDVCLVDYHLDEMRTGLEIIREAIQRNYTVPLIVITGREEREIDVEATEAGASGFLVKHFLHPVPLERSIRYAIERKRVEVQLKQMKEELDRHAEILQRDLDIAVDFQQSVLPEFPEISFLQYDYRYYPFGGGVSGDIYDVSLNRDQDVNIFLGDATGHGIVAAFMTMKIQIGLDSIRGDLPTNQVLSHLNMLLASRDRAERYVSGVYLRISPSGLLQASNAGHVPVIIIPVEKSDAIRLEKRGLPLGLFGNEPKPYVEEVYQLSLGDRVFILTDGITEWFNQEKEMFGLERLIQMFQDQRKQDLNYILDHLLDYLKQWSQNDNCHDDLTILGFEYK